MKTEVTIMLILAVTILSGCQQGQDVMLKKNAELIRENNQLRHDLSIAKAENGELTKQINTLNSLDPESRKDVLSNIRGIEITSRTGIYDKNKDSIPEKLVTYLRIFDERGDSIKAPGSVNLQLWDLTKNEESALINEWDVTPEQLREMWANTFMTNYYRISFDISEVLKKDPNLLKSDLTLKVIFTDYLQGKTFSKQFVIVEK